MKRSRLRAIARLAEFLDGALTAPERLSERQLPAPRRRLRNGFAEHHRGRARASRTSRTPTASGSCMLPYLDRVRAARDRRRPRARRPTAPAAAAPAASSAPAPTSSSAASSPATATPALHRPRGHERADGPGLRRNRPDLHPQPLNASRGLVNRRLPCWQTSPDCGSTWRSHPCRSPPSHGAPGEGRAGSAPGASPARATTGQPTFPIRLPRDLSESFQTMTPLSHAITHTPPPHILSGARAVKPALS